MKVDKDALIKHRFWILLGVFALLWIICLSFVVANAGGPIDEAQKNYKTAKDAVAKYPRPKNASFLPPWEKYGDTFTKHKMAVWKKAWEGDAANEKLAPGQKRWEGQGDMYHWPSDANHPLDNVLLYPDRPFETRLREWYKTNDAYGKEFKVLQQELQPDGGAPAVKGKPPAGPLGAVVFRGGYDNVMRPIDFPDRTPDAEECWIAQEDFWVKRELLYVVRDALSMAARLDPVADASDKKEEPAAKGAKPAADAKDKPAAEAPDKKAEAPAKDAKYLGRQVFRNASWEVTLLFDKDEQGKQRISPNSRIKNVHVSHREQTLGNPAVPIDGAFFRLSQGEAYVIFNFQGEKVPWDKERPLGFDKGFPLSSAINPTQPVELEQIFDRGDTPIASVDEIRIPYVSARNANRPLVAAPPKRFGKTEAAAATATPTGGAGALGGGPPGMTTMPTTTPAGTGAGLPAGGFGMQTGGMGAMGGQGGATATGAQPSTDRTANIGLDRARYLFVTDQSRHLPLALTVTVDQSHLHEMLVAMANSKLRFQTTQVEFRRQSTGAGAAAPAGFPPPGGTGAAVGDMPLTPSAPPPGFAPPGFRRPGSAPAAMTTPTLENPNLVEVTIYGVASLYERPREDKK
jgi:hypothetical protein